MGVSWQAEHFETDFLNIEVDLLAYILNVM